MLNIQHDHILAPHTTLKVGGPAEHFVKVTTVDKLKEAISWAHAKKKRVTMLGGGSNVLISDEGLNGLVIQNGITGIEVKDEDAHAVTLVATSGTVFDVIVRFAIDHGYWGLENLSHIPGSVGATPIQNVGAYGVEIKDLITWVEVYDTHTAETRVLTNDACQFTYRNSFFKSEEGKQLIILRIAFRLSKQPSPILTYRDLAEWFAENDVLGLSEIREAVIAIRKKKFPDWRKIGTAGSFFKNPIIPKEPYHDLVKRYPDLPSFPIETGEVKIPLGWILDHVLNLRGVSKGSVGTFAGQALVLINNRNATAREFDAFARTIEQKVFDTTGIVIEREVTTLR